MEGEQTAHGDPDPAVSPTVGVQQSVKSSLTFAGTSVTRPTDLAEPTHGLRRRVRRHQRAPSQTTAYSDSSTGAGSPLLVGRVSDELKDSFLRKHFAGWGIGAATLTAFSLATRWNRSADSRADASLSQSFQIPHLVAVVAFAMGTMLPLLAWATTRPKDQVKRSLSLCLAGVNLCAGLSYAFMLLGLDVTLLDPYHGQPMVQPIRYLEWLACTPILVQLTHEITRTRSQPPDREPAPRTTPDSSSSMQTSARDPTTSTAHTVTPTPVDEVQMDAEISTALHANTLVHTCGLLGAVLPRPYADVGNLVSTVAFLYLQRSLRECFQRVIRVDKERRRRMRKQMNARGGGDRDRGRKARKLGRIQLDVASIRVAEWVTVVSSWMFPVAFGLYVVGAISPLTLECGFVAADILAKVFYTVVLSNATIESTYVSKIASLRHANQRLRSMVEDLGDEVLDRVDVKMYIRGGEVNLNAGTGEEQEGSRHLTPYATPARNRRAETLNCTVILINLANLSALSHRNDSGRILKVLEGLWQDYDRMAKSWRLCKAGTVGDAYLAVSGWPLGDPHHARSACSFALSVLDHVRNSQAEHVPGTGMVVELPIEVKVGLCTGVVSVGAVPAGGVDEEAQPTWVVVGEAVDMASAMELTSKPGCIHLTESTFLSVTGVGERSLVFDGPDYVDLPGRGTATTYWLLGRTSGEYFGASARAENSATSHESDWSGPRTPEEALRTPAAAAEEGLVVEF